MQNGRAAVVALILAVGLAGCSPEQLRSRRIERNWELFSSFSPEIQSKIRLGEIEASELEAARYQVLESWTGALGPSPADRVVAEAQRAAMDWILGVDYQPIEFHAAELKSVTPDDVVAFHGEMASTALFALPSGASLHTGHVSCYSCESIWTVANRLSERRHGRIVLVLSEAVLVLEKGWY